ncbi:MAG: hypothetical protein CML93_03160 [Rhodobiaceae bacterium]|nr:hypothetical protein [Rhodobiaceae bacterium]
MRFVIDFIKNEKYELVFYLLLLIAFTLRIYGIDSYRGIDESYEVNRALNALNGEFDWSRNLKGGLYIILIPLYAIASIFTNDYHSFIIIGRCVQVIIGLGIIYAIYRCLSLFYDRQIVLLFLLPPIFSSKLITSAHFVNVQNLMYLGILIHLYLIFCFFDTQKNNYLYRSFIPLSIAVSCSALALITWVPFFILIMIVIKNYNHIDRSAFVKKLMRYLLLSIGIYLILTPGIIISFQQNLALLMKFMGFTSQFISDKAELESFMLDVNKNIFLEYSSYIKNYFGRIQLFIIIGSIITIFVNKKWKYFYPIGIFLAFFIVLLSAPKYMYDGKYLIPGLIMGYIIMPHLHSSIGHYVKKKGFIYEKIYIVFTCLILILFLRSGYNSGKKVLEYGLPDTRVLMAEWLNQNTNKNDKILLQDTQNFPVVPHADQAIYIDHWDAYPKLNDVKADFIIINKETIQYLNNKNINANYITFYNELSKSDEWNLTYSLNPIKKKISGPDLEIFSKK